MSDITIQSSEKTRSEDTIINEAVVYIPCSLKIYRTLAEVAQNDFIVRNPGMRELIMKEFSQLFVSINDNED